MSPLVISAEDRAACRAWIRHHSKSFYLSSLLLPAQVREGAWALYAFCRRADDAVDEGPAGAGALARVEALRRRLDLVYADGEEALDHPPDHPIDRAFRVVATRHRIPRALPEALLAGMEMDAREARYETWDDLVTYCFRVAATVGLMMTRIMGCAADVAWLRAADLGVAMQLTNIARDVGEDARRGRVYLPRALLAEVGTTPEAVLAAREATPALREAVRRLLAEADRHYRAADLGVPLLPRACRFAITSSRLIYSRIGEAIRARGHDAITGRAYVPLGGKLLLVARATLSLLPRPGAEARARASVGPADAALGALVRGVGLPVPALPDPGVGTRALATRAGARPSPAGEDRT